MIRVGFWSILCHNCNKEPPKTTLAIYHKDPYITQISCRGSPFLNTPIDSHPLSCGAKSFGKLQGWAVAFHSEPALDFRFVILGTLSPIIRFVQHRNLKLRDTLVKALLLCAHLMSSGSPSLLECRGYIQAKMSLRTMVIPQSQEPHSNYSS